MRSFFTTIFCLNLLALALVPVSCHFSPTDERATMARWHNVPDSQDFFYDDDVAREIMERGHMDF